MVTKNSGKKLQVAAKLNTLVPYTIKSGVLILVLFVLSKTLPLMPALPVGCIWAALSFVSTLGVMHQVVVRKTLLQYMFVKGSLFAQINSGRIISSLISFIISGFCMASLLIESTSWNAAQWILILFSVPLFFAVSFVVEKFVKRQLKPTFKKAYFITITAVVVGILLCIIYLALSLISSEENYDTLLQALLTIPNNFVDSPSAILKDVGVFKWAGEAWSNYYISEMATVSHYAYSILRVVVCAGAFFGISNLLGFCCLNLNDIKKTVQELPSHDNDTDLKTVKRFVVASIVFPIVLACGFTYADNCYRQIKTSNEYTWAEQQMRILTSKAIFVKDGVYYDKEKVIKHLNEADNEVAATQKVLSNKSEELRSEIDNAYDSASSKVEDFLNWYYNLPSNTSELSDFTEENAQTHLQEKFCEKTIEGYDSHSIEINSRIKNYIKALNSYVDSTYAKLESCKVDNIPSWIIVPENVEDLPTNNLTYAFLINAEKVQSNAKDLGLTDANDEADIFSNRIISATSTTNSYQKIESKVKEIVSRLKNSLNIVNVLDVQLIDQFTNRQTYKEELQNAINEDKDRLLEILLP